MAGNHKPQTQIPLECIKDIVSLNDLFFLYPVGVQCKKQGIQSQCCENLEVGMGREVGKGFKQERTYVCKAYSNMNQHWYIYIYFIY